MAISPFYLGRGLTWVSGSSTSHGTVLQYAMVKFGVCIRSDVYRHPFDVSVFYIFFFLTYSFTILAFGGLFYSIELDRLYILEQLSLQEN